MVHTAATPDSSESERLGKDTIVGSEYTYIDGLILAHSTLQRQCVHDCLLVSVASFSFSSTASCIVLHSGPACVHRVYMRVLHSVVLQSVFITNMHISVFIAFLMYKDMLQAAHASVVLCRSTLLLQPHVLRLY
jgi:hypothetical protein